MDGVTPQYKPPDWVDPKILIANKKNLSSRKKKTIYCTWRWILEAAHPRHSSRISAWYIIQRWVNLSKRVNLPRWAGQSIIWDVNSLKYYSGFFSLIPGSRLSFMHCHLLLPNLLKTEWGSGEFKRWYFAEFGHQFQLRESAQYWALFCSYKRT